MDLARSGLHPHPGPQRGWYERMVDPSDDELECRAPRMPAVEPAQAPGMRRVATPAVERLQMVATGREHPVTRRDWYQRMVDPSDDELDHDSPRM